MSATCRDDVIMQPNTKLQTAESADGENALNYKCISDHCHSNSNWFPPVLSVNALTWVKDSSPAGYHR